VERTDLSTRAAMQPPPGGAPDAARVQANRIRERLRQIAGMPELQPIAAQLRARMQRLDDDAGRASAGRAGQRGGRLEDTWTNGLRRQHGAST
jgi:hypothetical protein